LSINDKKEGRKKLPFVFKTELKIADNVTKIKKGNVIGNNILARLN
jgi:hypothetical protein